MILFTIPGISVFFGIIFSIASLPETEQMNEVTIVKDRSKEIVGGANDAEKAESAKLYKWDYRHYGKYWG